MVDNFTLQWLLCLTFCATGAHALWELLQEKTTKFRVNQTLHLSMSALMASMCWSWWYVIPTVPQVILFMLATLWFLGQFLTSTRQMTSHTMLKQLTENWPLLAHAVMMAAMSWMVLAMAPTPHADINHTIHAPLPHHHLYLGVGFSAALIGFGSVYAVHCLVGYGAKSPSEQTRNIMGLLMFAGMASMTWMMLAH